MLMSLGTYELWSADARRVFCPLLLAQLVAVYVSVTRLVSSVYARRVFFRAGGLSRRREGNEGVDRRAGEGGTRKGRE